MNVGRICWFLVCHLSYVGSCQTNWGEKHNYVCRELKKVTIEDGNSSKTRFEVQDKQMFKKRFSNHVHHNTPRVNKIKVSTPNPQEGKGGCSYVEKPLCAKCGRKHDGKCLVCTSKCYDCGKSGHMKRYFPMMKAQGRQNAQEQANAPISDVTIKEPFMLSNPKVIKRALRIGYRYVTIIFL